MLRTDQNERVRIIELAGVAADTLTGALSEMATQAAGSRATRPLYHVSISPDPKAPPMTKAQWERTIDRLEERLGLKGCARVVLEHEKEGRTHRHVVWSRTSPLTGRIVSDSLNWKIHGEVAAELEAEFNHGRTRRAYDRPDGSDRKPQNPKDWEEQQKSRTGIDPRQVKREVTAVYRASDSGKAFQAGLAAAGYILARGDKPGAIVLIDRAGGLHGLTRRIEGATAAEIRARLSDLDPAALPSVTEARAGLRDKDAGRAATSPREAQERPSKRVSVHPGRLPKPSGLGRRSFGGPSVPKRMGLERGRSVHTGGKAPKPSPTPRNLEAPRADFAIPQDRPGINPLEVLDAIQKLKKALGAGAEVGESLRRMEALYGRLMLNG